MLTFSIKSFILFRVLRKVDLPQPEGPINAVTIFSGIFIEMFFKARFVPYLSDKSLTFTLISFMKNYYLALFLILYRNVTATALSENVRSNNTRVVANWIGSVASTS